MKISRIVLWSLYTVLSVFVCLYLHHAVVPAVFGGNARFFFEPAAHELADAKAFAQFLDQYGAGIEEVRKKKISPALYPLNLPANLASLPAADKASVFISLVLPNVLRVNEEIRATRRRMLALLDKKDNFKRLTRKEQWWLNKLAWQYGCSPEDVSELRLRVDTVPVALALAQAITESAWGTSRFAQAGNALYGQHLSSQSNGNYILSRHGNVKMAAFDSIYDATRSYINNLNRVRAYTDLRRQRAALKEQGLRVTGHELAGGLGRYSEIGVEYVSDLRYIITRYELERLNGVRLRKKAPGQAVRFER